MTNRKQVGKPAIVQRPTNLTGFTADVAAGKYETDRPSIIVATDPPILAASSKNRPAQVAVTELYYRLVLPREATESIPPFGSLGSRVRPGATAYSEFGPTSANGGEPLYWRDDGGVAVDAWSYSLGLWNASIHAPITTATVHVELSMSVPTQDVEFQVILYDQDANNDVYSSPILRMKNINKPEYFALDLDLDTRSIIPGDSTSISRFRMIPGTPYAVDLARTDAQGTVDVTLKSFSVTVRSHGVR